MKFSLMTPENPILQNKELEELVLPAYKGELNILPDHAPLLTTVSTGILKYKLKDSPEVKEIMISGGYCEVLPFKALVLAEIAEFPEDIDLEKARQGLKETEEKLSKVVELEPKEIDSPSRGS